MYSDIWRREAANLLFERLKSVNIGLFSPDFAWKWLKWLFSDQNSSPSQFINWFFGFLIDHCLYFSSLCRPLTVQSVRTSWSSSASGVAVSQHLDSPSTDTGPAASISAAKFERSSFFICPGSVHPPFPLQTTFSPTIYLFIQLLICIFCKFYLLSWPFQSRLCT